MQNNFSKLLWSFCVCAALAACSPYKSKFDCKPGASAGCTSSSKVLELSDNEELDEFLEVQNAKKSRRNQASKRSEAKPHTCCARYA